MPIRLSKACKDLNVGMNTAIDFLAKKGHKLTADPNVKLTDEMFLLLAKEFNKDMALKIESERISQERQLKEKQETVALDDFIHHKPAEKEIETIPTTIPADQVPHLKSVGYIDLEEQIKKSKEKKEEVISQTSAKEKELTTKQKIQLKEEKLPETIIPEKEKVTNIETTVSPKIELEEIKKEKTTVEKKEKILVAEVEEKEKTVEPKKISSKIKAESAEKVEKQQISHEVEEKNLIGREEIFTAKIEETAENEEENEIFEIAHPILDTNLTVIGTIDLDAINQSTRPKSKSKEQKKKEYAEKNRLLNESKKFAPSKSKKIIKLSEEETDEVELDEFKEQH
ncbi:MAG TPA: translation initiation factor IF-2, partial [Paludibacteraceae bacterium]|nr:translation initiation factor IF-2 [Paludibacteraceae bacterium]